MKRSGGGNSGVQSVLQRDEWKNVENNRKGDKMRERKERNSKEKKNPGSHAKCREHIMGVHVHRRSCSSRAPDHHLPPSPLPPPHHHHLLLASASCLLCSASVSDAFHPCSSSCCSSFSCASSLPSRLFFIIINMHLLFSSSRPSYHCFLPSLQRFSEQSLSSLLLRDTTN